LHKDEALELTSFYPRSALAIAIALDTLSEPAKGAASTRLPCRLSCDMTCPAPIAFLDVAYAPSAVGVGCLLTETWTTATAMLEFSRCLRCSPVEYRPGQFYKRELPVLLTAIEGLCHHPQMVVIDGYVWLGQDGAPGLGAYLFGALHSQTPVVGIAKRRYRQDTWSERVYRGTSHRPLYVTAAGIETTKAAGLVARMHGKYRLPTLLGQVDRLARAAAAHGWR
jgi:deoxyribonuclease V